MPRQPRRFRRRVGMVFLVLCMAVTAAVGFGVSGADAAALLDFTQCVSRWQLRPEFRAIALEYSSRGSAAVGTRPFLVPARRLIVAARSIPGLPKEFALNPTSRAHYENFGRGPLSAYLHLSREQDVPAYLAAVEDLARTPNRTPVDYLAWLEARKMDFPLVKDAGAVQSLRTVVEETDAGRGFVVRDNVADRLRPQIETLALMLGVPADPADMTPDEQQAVLDRLDGYVRRHDPELWRTKQVNDLCGGIWAQVFGPPYNRLLVPFLTARAACQFLFVTLLMSTVFQQLAVRRALLKARAEPANAGS